MDGVRLPFQQSPLGDREAHQGQERRVGEREGLVREERYLQPDAREHRRNVLAHR